MISDFLPELTEMVGHDEAVKYIEMWLDDKFEKYADEMTSLWQSEQSRG